MSFSVVYADKDKIQSSIKKGIIPKESLILTTGNEQSEAYYYDDVGKLKYITKKTSFDSLLEARVWVAKYDYEGEIISVYENNKWVPYIVGKGQTITAIQYGKDKAYDLINGGDATVL